MLSTRSAVLGAACAVVARALLPHALRLKFDRDLRALNAGDYRPLLANYADDAVLRFTGGEHRWAGEHRGRAAIERFLQDFVAARITGEIGELFVAGPPWTLRLAVRFDDRSEIGGEELYRNRTVLVLRLRGLKIVEQEDFYEDTRRIDALEARLNERGIAPAR